VEDVVGAQGSGFSPKDTSCTVSNSFDDGTTNCSVDCCSTDGSATIVATITGGDGGMCSASGVTEAPVDITVTAYVASANPVGSMAVDSATASANVQC